MTLMKSPGEVKRAKRCKRGKVADVAENFAGSALLLSQYI
jgi:hypothetical protein